MLSVGSSAFAQQRDIAIAPVTPQTATHDIGTIGSAGRRVALVIGVANYKYVPALSNPSNDATLIANTLKGLGFTLVEGGAVLDPDKASFDRIIQEFGETLKGASVGLFYYAGHGIQVRDTNWLVPTTANPTSEADVEPQMVDIQQVMRAMEHAGTKLNMVILDACRNNPFAGRDLVGASSGLATAQANGVSTNDSNAGTGRALRGTSGLAKIEAPEGTVISYATQPGNVAEDGSDGDSPFTEALAHTIKEPGLDVFRAFNEVGLEVKRATNSRQQPWVSSSPIDGDFYFAGAPTTENTADALAKAAQAKAESDSLRAQAEHEAAAVKMQMALASGGSTNASGSRAIPSQLQEMGTIKQVSKDFGFLVGEKKAGNAISPGQYAFVKTSTGFEVTRVAKVNGDVFSLTGVYADNDSYLSKVSAGDIVFVAK
jgi:uncharacterized caspase-like protein